MTVAKDEVYVFGGCGNPGKTTYSERHRPEELPVCLGDLHVFNVARQRWREVGIPAGKTRPVQRTCAVICASEEEDRLFLSGGAGDDPYDLRGDLLQYDVRERTWSVLYDGGGVETAGLGSQSCPFRRIGHTMVHHSASNRLVLFGGSTGRCQHTPITTSPKRRIQSLAVYCFQIILLLAVGARGVARLKFGSSWLKKELATHEEMREECR